MCINRVTAATLDLSQTCPRTPICSTRVHRLSEMHWLYTAVKGQSNATKFVKFCERKTHLKSPRKNENQYVVCAASRPFFLLHAHLDSYILLSIGDNRTLFASLRYIVILAFPFFHFFLPPYHKVYKKHLFFLVLHTREPGKCVRARKQKNRSIISREFCILPDRAIAISPTHRLQILHSSLRVTLRERNVSGKFPLRTRYVRLIRVDPHPSI